MLPRTRSKSLNQSSNQSGASAPTQPKKGNTMPLNYDLQNVEADLDDKNVAMVSNALVWGTLSIAMGKITKENWKELQDIYAEDVEKLSLSSFNPSLGNFDSVDQAFGPLNYLGNYNDDLVGLQQNKLSLIPVNKNIIEFHFWHFGADNIKHIRSNLFVWII